MQKWNGRRHRPVMKCLMHGGTFKTFNCHSNYKFDAQKISHGSAVNFSVSISVTQIRKTASAAKRVLTCERLSSRQAYAQLGWPSSTRSWDAAKEYYFGSSFGHFTKENEKQFQHLPFAIWQCRKYCFFLLLSSIFSFFRFTSFELVKWMRQCAYIFRCDTQLYHKLTALILQLLQQSSQWYASNVDV